MAQAFASFVLASDKGSEYTVTLTVVDHVLRIKNGADQPATLHVTRFEGVRTLSELDEIIRKASRSIEQISQGNEIIARAAGEGPPVDPENPDWKLREGVYRIAVVSPLYEPEVRYVQLTDKGELETKTYLGTTAMPTPTQWQVALHKRSREDKSQELRFCLSM